MEAEESAKNKAERKILTTLSLPLNLPIAESLGSSCMPTSHLARGEKLC